MDANHAPVYRVLPSSTLAWLCHYANADPSWNRDCFYKLKLRLLHQFAVSLGIITQEITKECWGDQWDDDGYRFGCGPECTRCKGTGIFDQRWVYLEKWQWGKYTFLVPDGFTRIKPPSVEISGHVIHPNYGKASREAELWLYVATLQWKTWWKTIRSSCYTHPGWWPMCRIQKVVMHFRLRKSFQKCPYCLRWCPRLWPGRRWHRRCQNRLPVQAIDFDDAPF